VGRAWLLLRPSREGARGGSVLTTDKKQKTVFVRNHSPYIGFYVGNLKPLFVPLSAIYNRLNFYQYSIFA
jgi:hypothetical protein